LTSKNGLKNTDADIAFVSQLDQTDCRSLFETKDAHTRERIDVAIASKN